MTDTTFRFHSDVHPFDYYPNRLTSFGTVIYGAQVETRTSPIVSDWVTGELTLRGSDMRRVARHITRTGE
jgi:hypothetical protein